MSKLLDQIRPARWVIAGQPQIELTISPTHGTFIRVTVNTFGKTKLESADSQLIVHKIMFSVEKTFSVKTALIRCNTEQKPGKYFSKIITVVSVGDGFTFPSETHIRAAKELYRRILLAI